MTWEQRVHARIEETGGFAVALAKVSEGFCPSCDDRLIVPTPEQFFCDAFQMHRQPWIWSFQCFKAWRVIRFGDTDSYRLLCHEGMHQPCDDQHWELIAVLASDRPGAGDVRPQDHR